MDDIFSQFGDIFGSAFGGGFEGFGGNNRGVSKGANLRIRVKLSLEEIFNGVDKKVKVKRKNKSSWIKFYNMFSMWRKWSKRENSKHNFG